MADSDYNIALKIAFELDKAADLESARAAVARLFAESKQADQASTAFQQLGMDITHLRTGMTASEQTIVSALRTIASDANTTGAELRAGVVAALQQIKSPAALQQVQNDLKELSLQGRNTSGALGLFGGATMDLTERVNLGTAGISKMGKATQETGGMFGQLGGMIKGLGLAYLGKQAMDAADGMTRLDRGFQAVFHSSEAAGQQIEFVRGISNRLGIDLTKTAESYLALAAAAQGTNLQGQKTRDIFESVAGAMATLGKSSDDTNGALLALNQMISKGTVQSEELRGQLGERLPGAFQLAAKAMGVSTAELQKMLEQGQVLAEDLLPRLATELNKTYGDGAKQVDTFAAAFTRLWNATKDTVSTTAGTGVQTFFTGIIDGAGKAVTALEAIPIAVKGTGEAIGNMAGAVASGTSVLDAGAEAAVTTGTAFENLGYKMLGVASPAQFAAEMTAKFAEQLEVTRTPLEKLQEATKGNLQALPADLKAIIEGLNATGDAAVAAEAAFKKFADAPAKLVGQEGVLQLSQTIQLVEQNAQGAGDAIREKLGKSLEDLTTTQLANLGTEAQKALDSLANNENARKAIIGLGQVVDAVAVEAMRRLGIDGQEALTGIDAKTKEALADLELLAKTAGVSAQVIRQAFTDLIAAANTQQELDALTARLQQLGKDGKLSAEDVALGLAQIQAKAATVAESLDPVQQALNRIGMDGREAITGVDAQFQGMIGTLQVLAKEATVSGEALLLAVDKATQAATTRKELELVSVAIKQMGEDGKLTGEQVKEALAAITVESSKMVAATDAVGQAFKTLGITGHTELQAIADQAVLAFDTLRASGQTSVGDLNVAFEAMAEKVLKAAQAMGPLAETTAAWKLRAMAATEEQRTALEQLIQKYAESGTAATAAAAEQITAANNAAVAIENYSARVEARAGAGALAFQKTTDALNQQSDAYNRLSDTQKRVIDGYNELTATGKEWAQQELQEAQIADSRVAGTILYRDETGKTIQEIQKLIAQEKQEAEQVAELRQAYEDGTISAGSLKSQLSQLALQLRDPLTTAGNSAKKTIQELLKELLNLSNSSQDTVDNLNNIPTSFDEINASLATQTSQIDAANKAMQNLHAYTNRAIDLIGNLGSLDISSLKTNLAEVAGHLDRVHQSALNSTTALRSIAEVKLI